MNSSKNVIINKDKCKHSFQNKRLFALQIARFKFKEAPGRMRAS